MGARTTGGMAAAMVAGVLAGVVAAAPAEARGCGGRAYAPPTGADTNAETWYQQLMVSSGELGRATVPWGNNAATPQIRAFAPMGSPGVFVSFVC